MLKLKPMPEIWSSDIYVLASQVAGSFAKWAVRQSPFIVPINLEKATMAVDTFAKKLSNGKIILEMPSNKFRELLEEFFEKTLVIEDWNHPLSGKERTFYSGDRYGNHQKPEDDIIDLGALARNITHDLILHHEVDKAQDNYRTC